MTKKRRNRPEVDGLLPDVDEEIQGGGSKTSSQAEKENDREDKQEDGKAASSSADKELNRQDDMSTLARQLEVLMTGPAAPYEGDLPELGARANGYLNTEVERALQQASSVLKNRFEGVSKSLIMNYAIRVALWDLRENADNSQLVRWLEKVTDTDE